MAALTTRPIRALLIGIILAATVLMTSVQRAALNKPSSFKRVESSAQLERKYNEWLSTFKAANSEYTEYCLDVLKNSKRFDNLGAQYSQDIFLFRNLYKYWPMQGRKGFYVESGANDATHLSTSFFFDVCLGWEGLCIEPQPQYHEKLRTHRSCKLVPECLSDKPGNLTMSTAGVSSAMTPTGSLTVQCAPLIDMLQRFSGRTSVDVWILDVEGFELQVLRGTNFSAITVDAMLIEYVWLKPVPAELDLIMTSSNFYKYAQMAIDSVFVRQGTPAAHSTSPLWYPPTFNADVTENDKYMQGQHNQLMKSWGWT